MEVGVARKTRTNRRSKIIEQLMNHVVKFLKLKFRVALLNTLKTKNLLDSHFIICSFKILQYLTCDILVAVLFHFFLNWEYFKLYNI